MMGTNEINTKEGRAPEKRGGPVALLLAIAGLLLGVVIVAIAVLNSSSLKEYIREELIHLARQQGLSLSLESAACSVKGCEIRNATLFIPDLLLMVKVENLIVVPKLLSFVRNHPEFEVEGNVYGGSFSGVLSYANHRDLEASLNATGLQAKDIPQLSAFGIAGGTIDFELASFTQSGSAIGFHRGVLRATNLAKPGRTSPSVPTSAGALTLDFPAITATAINLETAMANGKLNIADVRIESSLMNASGQGEVSLVKSPTISLSAKATLSDAGLKEVGALLPLVSQGVLTQNSRAFEMRLEGSLAEPKVRFSPSA